MTKQFVYSLDVEDIEKGFSDDTARRMLEIWKASNGAVTDEFVSLSPHTVLFKGNAKAGDVPDLLLTGNDALANTLLQDGWADSAQNARQTFDDDYREMVGRGYEVATRCFAPVFDLVSSRIRHWSGELVDLKYQRLIVPLMTGQGAVFLACYSRKVGSIQPAVDPQRGEQSPQDRQQQSRDYAAMRRPAGFSSAARLVVPTYTPSLGDIVSGSCLGA